LLERALKSWEEAGLGLRFRRVEAAAARIRIRFAEDSGAGWQPDGIGDTVTDCAVGRAFDAAPAALEVEAEMRFASIVLRRHDVDMLGRAHGLLEAELLGAAIHELGHALGFAGHVASGGSIMLPSPETVRAVGRRVLAGARFEDATLTALYSIPSGSVVGRLAPAPRGSRSLRWLAERAGSLALRGPFVRVGEGAARLFWRTPEGHAVGFDIDGWRGGAGELAEYTWVPNARAARILGER